MHHSRFSSARERRLWIWAALVAGAIYASIPLGSLLAGPVRNDGLAAAVFITAMLLTAVAVLVFALRLRPRGLELGVLLGVAVAYGMLLLRLTLAERSHVIEYSVLAAIVHEALGERASQGRGPRTPALAAIALTALIGAVDEGVQLLIPWRVFDPVDILFNSLAALMAVTALVLLRLARRAAARVPRSSV